MYEQKPGKIDIFNENEEKKNRREVAEINKHLKKKRKLEDNKQKEVELFNRHRELNDQFKNIKESKKERKKKKKKLIKKKI